MKAYISGPLQSAVNLVEARAFYESLAQTCAAAGWDAYLPHQNTDPELHRFASTSEVFDRDLSAMIAADLIVAYIGHPSSGVGAELGIAFARGKPVVALHGAEEAPSRFLTGMLSRAVNTRVFNYVDLSDCKEKLKRHLEEVRAAL